VGNGLTSCQTQLLLVQLCAELDEMYVRRATIPNILGFSYVLSTNRYESGELSNSRSLMERRIVIIIWFDCQDSKHSSS
jgi:hypothetical protein